ncbi:MAG: hypothetical protein ABSB11_07600 [Sedimentisphaerales bacterium]|jgi:hypothetical protein
MLFDTIMLGVSVLLFALLFIPILTAVRQIPLFGEGNAVFMAVVVTLLCILAMWVLLVPAAAPKQTEGERDGFLFLLIPYAALAISILAILLVRFLMKASGIKKTGERPREKVSDINSGPAEQPMRRSTNHIVGLTNYPKILRKSSNTGKLK